MLSWKSGSVPKCNWKDKFMESLTTILLWLLVSGCVLVGLIGTVIPILPGSPLILVGIIIAGWINDFQYVGSTTITIAAIITALSLAMDFIATSIGAKRVGASRMAIAGAALGTLVGAFFLIPGLIVGPFLGAVTGELLVNRNLKKAGKAGLGTWAGLLLGTAAKIALALTMIAVLLVGLIVR